MPYLMIDVEGTELTEVEIALLRLPLVCSVVLFANNFTSQEQLYVLTTAIRQARPDIFIFVDHEGGDVQRFRRNGFFPLPAGEVYGDIYDQSPEAAITLARKYGERMARDLLALGVNCSLAPVLDLKGGSPVIEGLHRAFHKDPKVVGILAEAFIQGMHEAGMPCVGKHAPGHGYVPEDSHTTQPALDVDRKTLFNRDLVPFKTLIDKGLLDAIMPAHVIYPEVDPEATPTFSPIWEKVFREELGFKGLIISDCLSMTGADIGDMLKRSEEAGKYCDLLIISHQSRDVLQQVHSHIEQTLVPGKHAASGARLNTFCHIRALKNATTSGLTPQSHFSGNSKRGADENSATSSGPYNTNKGV